VVLNAYFFTSSYNLQKKKCFVEVWYIFVFRTIFYISIVYAIGNVVISFASATGAIEIPAR
jgi:hypothetical protein